jgi:hypothetical protein
LGFEGSPARGSSLNLVLENPDISALSLTASYDASSGSTGTLTVTGWPTSFNITGTDTPDYPYIDNGQYDLTAQITKTGQPISGTLDIGGTIPGLASSGTLLTGQLSQFGFESPPGGDIFEFLFNITGGDLASYYHGQAGIILTANGSGFDGSFTTNFATAASQAIADNFAPGAVPEPTTAILLLSILAVGLPALVRHRSYGTSAVK